MTYANIDRLIERRDPALVEARHHLVTRDGPPRRAHKEFQDVELDCSQPQRALVAPGFAGAGNGPNRPELEHLRADSPGCCQATQELVESPELLPQPTPS